MNAWAIPKYLMRIINLSILNGRERYMSNEKNSAKSEYERMWTCVGQKEHERFGRVVRKILFQDVYDDYQSALNRRPTSNTEVMVSLFFSDFFAQTFWLETIVYDILWNWKSYLLGHNGPISYIICVWKAIKLTYARASNKLKSISHNMYTFYLF